MTTSPIHPSSAPAGAAGHERSLHHEHSAGLFHQLWRWAEAWLHFAQLRSKLALTEAKEAGGHYGVIAGLLIGALILALFAYVFVVLTVVFIVASLMDGPNMWLKIMASAAGLHIILAVAFVLLAKSRLKAGVFEKTKEEFRKDKLWQSTPSLPKNQKI